MTSREKEEPGLSTASLDQPEKILSILSWEQARFPSELVERSHKITTWLGSAPVSACPAAAKKTRARNTAPIATQAGTGSLNGGFSLKYLKSTILAATAASYSLLAARAANFASFKDASSVSSMLTGNIRRFSSFLSVSSS